MSDRRTQELIDNLASQGKETLAFFKGLSADDWETPVYSEETNWTVRTLLAHFVWTEKGMELSYRQIAEGGEGVPEDFDIDRWNASYKRRSDAKTPEELIEQFEEVRASYVDFVRSLDDEALERRGRSATQGTHRLRGLIHIPYHHTIQHLDDIKQALSKD